MVFMKNIANRENPYWILLPLVPLNLRLMRVFQQLQNVNFLSQPCDYIIHGYEFQVYYFLFYGINNLAGRGKAKHQSSSSFIWFQEVFY